MNIQKDAKYIVNLNVELQQVLDQQINKKNLGYIFVLFKLASIP